MVSQQDKTAFIRLKSGCVSDLFSRQALAAEIFANLPKKYFLQYKLNLYAMKGKGKNPLETCCKVGNATVAKLGFESRCPPDGILQQLWRSLFLSRLPSHEHRSLEWFLHIQFHEVLKHWSLVCCDVRVDASMVVKSLFLHFFPHHSFHTFDG